MSASSRPRRQTHGWRLALLLGLALAAWPGQSRTAPSEPPPGYVWADCKAFRARILRPASWLSKEDAQGCYFSPESFAASNWLEKGLTFYACPITVAETGKTADEFAAKLIADEVAKHGALRGSTKVGQPSEFFTTYSITYSFDRKNDGKKFVLTEVCVANHKTNTLYIWLLRSPSAEWQEVEPFEAVMLKNLQLDPEF